jgi:hypothetical protein
MTRKVANTKDDPTVPFVTLALKGTDYKLAYSFNALALAERATGLNMFRGLDLQALNALQLRAMLWASLLKAQPKMTLEDAGDLLSSPLDCNLALTAIADAWTASMPKPETVDPNV